MLKLKDLHEPIDYYGKTWIVLTICKEDLEPYLTKRQIAKLTDDKMSYLADKFADALMDCYWETLEVLLNYRKDILED